MNDLSGFGGVDTGSGPSSYQATQRPSGGWVIGPIAGDLDWDLSEVDTLVDVRRRPRLAVRRATPCLARPSGLLLFGAFFLALGALIGALSLRAGVLQAVSSPVGVVENRG